MDTSLAIGRGWEECIPAPPPGRSRRLLHRRGAKFGGASKIPSKNAAFSLVKTAIRVWAPQMTLKSLKTSSGILSRGTKPLPECEKPSKNAGASKKSGKKNSFLPVEKSVSQ